MVFNPFLMHAILAHNIAIHSASVLSGLFKTKVACVAHVKVIPIASIEVVKLVCHWIAR
jgi:hypothetical protein